MLHHRDGPHQKLKKNEEGPPPFAVRLLASSPGKSPLQQPSTNAPRPDAGRHDGRWGEAAFQCLPHLCSEPPYPTLVAPRNCAPIMNTQVAEWVIAEGTEMYVAQANFATQGYAYGACPARYSVALKSREYNFPLPPSSPTSEASPRAQSRGGSLGILRVPTPKTHSSNTELHFHPMTRCVCI